MRRYLYAVLAVLALASPAVAKPAEPRLGDIVMGKGNPKTVTVILSLSCVFCRKLDTELFPAKARSLVKRGYAIEIIPTVALPVDSAATAVLRCGSANGYLDRMRRIYASFSMITRMKPAQAQSWFLARETDFGFQKGAMAKCFAPARLERNEVMTKNAQARYHYQGTPTIYVDDVEVGHTIDDLP